MITDFGISVRHEGTRLGGLLLATAPRRVRSPATGSDQFARAHLDRVGRRS